MMLFFPGELLRLLGGESEDWLCFLPSVLLSEEPEDLERFFAKDACHLRRI